MACCARSHAAAPASLVRATVRHGGPPPSCPVATPAAPRRPLPRRAAPPPAPPRAAAPRRAPEPPRLRAPRQVAHSGTGWQPAGMAATSPPTALSNGELVRRLFGHLNDGDVDALRA